MSRLMECLCLGRRNWMACFNSCCTNLSIQSTKREKISTSHRYFLRLGRERSRCLRSKNKTKYLVTNSPVEASNTASLLKTDTITDTTNHTFRVAHFKPTVRDSESARVSRNLKHFRPQSCKVQGEFGETRQSQLNRELGKRENKSC